MLVLERKIQEGFWIEDRIFVKILGLGRRRVKIGIEAPRGAMIIRDELKARSSGNGIGPKAVEKEPRRR
jgi:carbon storage regulator CsrA